MNRHEFMRIYNNFYIFLREGEYTIVSPTAVGEEKGSRDPRDASREAVGSRGETAAGSWKQWGARARRRHDLGCVEGGSGEPGRDGGRRCWGETNLIIIIIIDIFSTMLYIN
jgi:hypothetical protein